MIIDMEPLQLTPRNKESNPVQPMQILKWVALIAVVGLVFVVGLMIGTVMLNGSSSQSNDQQTKTQSKLPFQVKNGQLLEVDTNRPIKTESSVFEAPVKFGLPFKLYQSIKFLNVPIVTPSGSPAVFHLRPSSFFSIEGKEIIFFSDLYALKITATGENTLIKLDAENKVLSSLLKSAPCDRVNGGYDYIPDTFFSGSNSNSKRDPCCIFALPCCG